MSKLFSNASRSLVLYPQCSAKRISASKGIHDWTGKTNPKDHKKLIPHMKYTINPFLRWKNKFNFWKLRWLFDRDFKESEFIRGAKQAAVVMTDVIRDENIRQIKKFTTPLGFRQITRDMLYSRKDSRLKLVQFETEHIRQAIPITVNFENIFGRHYCLVGMLFVGLRNTKDFGTTEKVVEVMNQLQKLESTMQMPPNVREVLHRILFAEILMTFRRDHGPVDGDRPKDKPDWSVSGYKIGKFDVLNYGYRTNF